MHFYYFNPPLCGALLQQPGLTNTGVKCRTSEEQKANMAKHAMFHTGIRGSCGGAGGLQVWPPKATMRQRQGIVVARPPSSLVKSSQGLDRKARARYACQGPDGVQGPRPGDCWQGTPGTFLVPRPALTLKGPQCGGLLPERSKWLCSVRELVPSAAFSNARPKKLGTHRGALGAVPAVDPPRQGHTRLLNGHSPKASAHSLDGHCLSPLLPRQPFSALRWVCPLATPQAPCWRLGQVRGRGSVEPCGDGVLDTHSRWDQGWGGARRAVGEPEPLGEQPGWSCIEGGLVETAGAWGRGSSACCGEQRAEVGQRGASAPSLHSHPHRRLCASTELTANRPSHVQTGGPSEDTGGRGAALGTLAGSHPCDFGSETLEGALEGSPAAGKHSSQRPLSPHSWLNGLCRCRRRSKLTVAELGPIQTQGKTQTQSRFSVQTVCSSEEGSGPGRAEGPAAAAGPRTSLPILGASDPGRSSSGSWMPLPGSWTSTPHLHPPPHVGVGAPKRAQVTHRNPGYLEPRDVPSLVNPVHWCLS